MEKRFTALALVFIILCSFVSAQDGGETQTPEEKEFEENPTADNLEKVQEPKKEQFEKLPEEEKSKYIEKKENIEKCYDCYMEYFGDPKNIGKEGSRDSEDAYFSNPKTDLGEHPAASEKYLQRKFGDSKVRFNIMKGMTFKDNPPKITHTSKDRQGNDLIIELVLKAGEEKKGMVPPGTEIISFDTEKKEFVFAPRGIEIKADSAVLNEDSSFTFASEGEITDKRTGAKITIKAGDNVKFTENGFELNGKNIPGEWKDSLGNTNGFINFDGNLRIDDREISSENSKIDFQGKELNGKFKAKLEGGKISNVALLDDASSYKDSYGKARGQLSIDFYADGNWKRAASVADSAEISYGRKISEEDQRRQHLFSGQVEINFRQDGSLYDTKLIAKKSSYEDTVNNVKVRSTDINYGIDIKNSQAKELLSKVDFSPKHIFFDMESSGVQSLLGSAGKNKETVVVINSRETGQEIYSMGKDLFLEVKDKAVYTLTDGTYSNVISDESGISIRLDKEQKVPGETFAIVGNKFTFGDMLAKEGFSQGEKEVFAFASFNEKGEKTVSIDKESMSFLGSINNPAKFALIKDNLILNIGQEGKEEAFFVMNTERGVTYGSASEKIVNVINAKNVHEYVGDDIDTVKSIVAKQAKTGEQGIDMQLLGLKKIFELGRGTSEDISDIKGQYQKSRDSFEKTKAFIKETYTSEFQKNAVLASFMITNLDRINPDSSLKFVEGAWAASEDDQQKREMVKFKLDALKEIEGMIKSDPSISAYFKRPLVDEPGQLNPLLDALVGKAQSSGMSPEEFKKVFAQQFYNRLAFEGLKQKVYEEDGTFKYNPLASRDEVIDSYRALIALEETRISETPFGMTSGRDMSAFSTAKLNLGIALALEYSKEDAMAGIAQIESLKKDLSNYVDWRTSGMDKVTVDKLYEVSERLDDMRGQIAATGFNKIQFNLLTQGNMLKEMYDKTKGYSEKVGDISYVDKEGYFNPESVLGVVIPGGLGKDIVRLAGGFDELRRTISGMQTENKGYMQGTYALDTLTKMGVPAETIDKWVNNKLTDKESTMLVLGLLEKSKRLEEYKQQETLGPGQEIITVAAGLSGEKKYIISKEDQEAVFKFLKQSRPDAKQLYDSDIYGSYAKSLVGTESIPYDEAKLVSNDPTERRLRMNTEEIKRKIGTFAIGSEGGFIGFVKSTLNWVDEMASPGAIAIAVGTGGAGLAPFGTSGMSGVALNLGEMLIIDAVTGGAFYASGLDPEDYPVLTAATGIAASFGASGFYSLLKKAGSGADDYARALAKNLNLESQSDDVVKALKNVNIDSADEITNALRKAGISVSNIDVDRVAFNIKHQWQKQANLQKAGNVMDNNVNLKEQTLAQEKYNKVLNTINENERTVNRILDDATKANDPAAITYYKEELMKLNGAKKEAWLQLDPNAGNLKTSFAESQAVHRPLFDISDPDYPKSSAFKEEFGVAPSGDFRYQTVTDEGNLVVVFGDGSGHSISGMRNSQAVNDYVTKARFSYEEFTDPKYYGTKSDVYAEANRAAFNNKPSSGAFSTNQMMMLTPDGELIVRGGGDRIRIFRAATGEVENIKPPGIFSGVIEDLPTPNLGAVRTKLNPGDKIIYYTDWAPESVIKGGGVKQLGDQRVNNLFESVAKRPSATPEDYVNAITKEANINDDVTLGVINFNGK